MSEEAAIADLARSGIGPDVAAQAGYSYTENAKKLSLSFARVPALVITYLDPITREPMRYGADGKEFIRVRYLEEVRNAKGKVIRYTQPKDSPIFAYFSACIDWPAILADPTQPVCFTEGEKKATACCLHGIPCIGLGGVWNWRFEDEFLPELELVEWRGRTVVICYDSDAATNPQVRTAELALAAELQRRGADVRVARLSPTADGQKQGADDYISAGQLNSLLDALTEAESPSSIDQDVIGLNSQVAYLEREDCVYVLEDDRKISKSSFMAGSQFSSLTTSGVRTVKGKAVPTQVPLAPIWLRHAAARRYADTVFRPDTDEREIPSAVGLLLNRWQGLRGTPGDVQPFLDLTQHLLRNSPQDVRDVVIKLLAYKAQHPAVKVPLAFVLIGPQGCGKSMWADIAASAFAPYNYSIPSAALKSAFQPFIESSLIVVIDEAQSTHTIGARDQLKTLISDQRQELNRKHVGQIQVDTFCQFILTSNDRRVGSFDRDDRRMVVIDCPTKREDAFYDRLGAWKKAGGASHLTHWLKAYDLQGWTPPKHAPQTQEKRMAFLENLNPIQKLADTMQSADANVVALWIKDALAWATEAVNSGAPHEAKHARSVMAVLSTIQIRPFYTPDELAMMFPAIVNQLYATKKIDVTPSGEISRQLRNNGIPYLPSADSDDGFRFRGQMQQFLVVADKEEWTSKPLPQAHFDHLIKHEFKTWREMAQQLQAAG